MIGRVMNTLFYTFLHIQILDLGELPVPEIHTCEILYYKIFFFNFLPRFSPSAIHTKVDTSTSTNLFCIHGE